MGQEKLRLSPPPLDQHLTLYITFKPAERDITETPRSRLRTLYFRAFSATDLSLHYLGMVCALMV